MNKDFSSFDKNITEANLQIESKQARKDDSYFLFGTPNNSRAPLPLALLPRDLHQARCIENAAEVPAPRSSSNSNSYTFTATTTAIIMGLCNVYRLTVCSFVLGAASVVFFALAISTDWWLTTRELHDPSMYMNPEEKSNLTVAPIWMRVWAGLWRLCVITENYPEYVNCMAVSYNVEDTGRGEKETLTSFIIVAAARRCVALPVSSLVLSIIAVVFICAGNIRKDCRTLLGGVSFILSGLSLAVGMILYISSVNDEVAFRVDTDGHQAGFSYAYGWSFFIAGFGFVSSELAAVVSVSLFLRRHTGLSHMAKIIPGLEDKISSSTTGSSSAGSDQQDYKPEGGANHSGYLVYQNEEGGEVHRSSTFLYDNV